MAKTINGLSREFIIHPGETLKEVIDDRGMTQRELAFRTGVKESHISSIVRCKKGISVSLAKKLEYALAIDSSFWINLQSNYEHDLQEFEEYNDISEEELKIPLELKDLIGYGQNLNILAEDLTNQEMVIELRKTLNISNLLNIPQLLHSGAFRISDKYSVREYTLYTWLRFSDLIVSKQTVENGFSREKLLSKLDDIRKLMFADFNTIKEELKKHFEECGIKFAVLRHFTGAPVQGVIKLDDMGTVSLIMTVRHKSADIFWFTLFHEIAHIIHDDLEGSRLIDYESDGDEVENRADQFAADQLIDPVKYRYYVENEHISIESIEAFCRNEQIPAFILVGRLQKDKYIRYDQFTDLKLKYEISDDL